jgi:hypothetical protein
MPEPDGPTGEELTEEELESSQEPDNTAGWVVLGGLLIIIVLIAWGLASIAPAISNWINDRNAPDFEPVACELPQVGEYCELYAEDLVALALETACQPVEVPACPPSADLNWWPADPNDIPTYLDNADKLIADMNEAAGIHESLQRLTLSFGGSFNQIKRAFDDPSWNILREEFDSRVSQIGGDLDTFWPPPPANSVSSLLDAHARLMMAYRKLDRVRDYVWMAERLDDPRFVYSYADDMLEQMRREIDMAQTYGLRNYR